MVIGIDVGISTTKIVGIEGSERSITGPTRIKADDPVTSLYGAFGKFLHSRRVSLGSVEQVMITGVGAGYIDDAVYGLPTSKIDEFTANGLGAKHFEPDLERMIVVSMGTGTSLVRVSGDEICPVGSLALGGGTLVGLSRVMLGTGDIRQILDLASKGNLKNIDVSIGDISPTPVLRLPADATASLFGNAGTDARREDIAAGIIRMVLQTVGSATILASLASGIRDYVMIGNLSLLPQCRELFPMMEKIYDVRFHIPPHSDFSGAIGAALSYRSSSSSPANATTGSTR